MYKLIGPDFKPHGPLSTEEVREWIKAGKANSQTYAQGLDTTKWQPLSSFPEFSDYAKLETEAGEQQLRSSFRSYLTAAVVCSLFCCWPFGVVAIYFAGKANGRMTARDYRGALAESREAKKWCWASFACGLVVIGGYLFVWFMSR